MVPDVRHVRFDIQPVRHHFVVRGIHVVRIVFGHIEPDQDVPKSVPVITEHIRVNVSHLIFALFGMLFLIFLFVIFLLRMFVLLTVFLENRISSMANMFVYKPVRDGILAVHTVRYPAVRIVVDHRRPVPVPVPDHKPVRMPDQLDHKPFLWDGNRPFERKQKSIIISLKKSVISSHVPDRLDE